MSRDITIMGRFLDWARAYWALGLASLLILSPALLDIPALGGFVVGLQYTREAVIGLLSVLVTARLVQSWTKRRSDERDRERFESISTIAYRSLSQTANDVGRIILAPLNGADLFSAGIPGFSPADHQRNLVILHSVQLAPYDKQVSGFWSEPDYLRMDSELEKLTTNSEFVEVMFRATSAARRRLQDSMADWAPVMITMPQGVEKLEPGMALADQLVLLSESWRALAHARQSCATEERCECLARVQQHYQQSIRRYRVWLDSLQVLAKLPSTGFTSLVLHTAPISP